jgi:transcriptional regulator with XRE-family HTH domain
MKRAATTAASRHRKTPDPLAAQVGALVKRLRKECEFTFDAFVEETGLGRGYISELERGLVVPTIHSLAKIARALDVTVADLVVGASERERLFALARELSPDDVRWLLARAEERVPPETLARFNEAASRAAASRAPPPARPADGTTSAAGRPSAPPPDERAAPASPRLPPDGGDGKPPTDGPGRGE